MFPVFRSDLQADSALLVIILGFSCVAAIRRHMLQSIVWDGALHMRSEMNVAGMCVSCAVLPRKHGTRAEKQLSLLPQN